MVAQFLMRCLFTMFAEDVQLIPTDSFKGLLASYSDSAEARGYLPDALQGLWTVMDKGGFSPELRTKLRRFNGQLFHDAKALPLNADQIKLLQLAADANWTKVEPAIFGTLLEWALDPTERHSLGAHYIPRRYVERLVLPTVIEPLRREWAAAQAASATRLDEGKGTKARCLSHSTSPHPRARRSTGCPPQASASRTLRLGAHRPLQRGGKAARWPASHRQRADNP